VTSCERVTGSVGLAATLAALEAGGRWPGKQGVLIVAARVAGKAAPRQDRAGRFEHSAIAQCLRGGRASEVGRLVLTASGGPSSGRAANSRT